MQLQYPSNSKVNYSIDMYLRKVQRHRQYQNLWFDISSLFTPMVGWILDEIVCLLALVSSQFTCQKSLQSMFWAYLYHVGTNPDQNTLFEPKWKNCAGNYNGVPAHASCRPTCRACCIYHRAFFLSGGYITLLRHPCGTPHDAVVQFYSL